MTISPVQIDAKKTRFRTQSVFINGHVLYQFQRHPFVLTSGIERKLDTCILSREKRPMTPSQIDAKPFFKLNLYFVDINFNKIGSIKVKLLSGYYEHLGQTNNMETVYPHKHSSGGIITLLVNPT